MSKLEQLKNRDAHLSKVRGWLDWIGEKCAITRKEVRDNCLADADCMTYFVDRFDNRGEHDKAAA